jgi:hypothetical protein
MNKGVFCIEGIWENDLRKRSSVRPILDILQHNVAVDYIYESCATVVELEFFIKKWCLRRYKDFPILYLAFHGKANEIMLDDHNPYSLDNLAELLKGKCKQSIVYFGSCSTLDLRRNYLKKFLEKTQALAICGYKNEVDWVPSTAFELLVLSLMQDNEFSGRGIASIKSKIEPLARKFKKELEFIMVTNQEVS